MKCPYCKTDIEENAHFCFYCMTSLEEKESVETPAFQMKYRVLAIAALFAVVLIVGGIAWWAFGPKPEKEPPEEQSAAVESLTIGTESENSVTQPNQNASGVTVGPATAPDSPSVNGAPDQSVSSPSAGNFDQPSSSGSGSASGNIGNGTTAGNVGSSTPSGKFGSGSVGSVGGTTAPGNPGSGSVGSTIGSGGAGGDTAGSIEPSAPTVQPEQTEPSAPSVTPNIPSERPEPESPAPENSDTSEDAGSTASAVTYSYRAAQYAVDDYHVTANVDDCVVITGVLTPAADGIYRIPSTLEGKRVIAVVKQAFNGETIRDTVKEVHLPASVRTVHDYAFSTCRNLTDIYFEGNSVYVSTLAFAAKEKRTGTLTIHCAYDCNNRDLRYYRNIAESYYDAGWSEA